MKRFHVHVAVENLGDSIRFYSDLFGMNPTGRAARLCQVDARGPTSEFCDFVARPQTRRESFGIPGR